MVYIWDYDRKELEKTEAGRIMILERAVNYGPGKDYQIRLSEVKKYWGKLDLFWLQKRFMELLIWGKYQSLAKDKKKYWIE